MSLCHMSLSQSGLHRTLCSDQSQLPEFHKIMPYWCSCIFLHAGFLPKLTAQIKEVCKHTIAVICCCKARPTSATVLLTSHLIGTDFHMSYACKHPNCMKQADSGLLFARRVQSNKAWCICAWHLTWMCLQTVWRTQQNTAVAPQQVRTKYGAHLGDEAPVVYVTAGK